MHAGGCTVGRRTVASFDCARNDERAPHTLTSDNRNRMLLSNDKVLTSDTPIMTDRADLLQGTLDLLVLKSLALGPLHGWGISKRIRQLSSDVLQVNQGSLYPALYRLEERGLLSSEWGISPENRRAKFYTLSAAGRREFAKEEAGWRHFASAVEQVLGAT